MSTRVERIVMNPGFRYAAGAAAIDWDGQTARWVQRGSVDDEEAVLRHVAEKHGTYVLGNLGRRDLEERLLHEWSAEFHAAQRRVIRRLMKGWELRIRYVPRYADGDFWYSPRGVLVSPDGETERVSNDVVGLFVSPPGCDWRRWHDFPTEDRAYWARLVGEEEATA